VSTGTSREDRMETEEKRDALRSDEEYKLFCLSCVSFFASTIKLLRSEKDEVAETYVLVRMTLLLTT